MGKHEELALVGHAPGGHGVGRQPPVLVALDQDDAFSRILSLVCGTYMHRSWQENFFRKHIDRMIAEGILPNIPYSVDTRR